MPIQKLPPRPVIIDTDADFDDFIALAWLLERSEINVKAIIYTGTGWSHSPQGAKNLCRFLFHIGHHEVPVYLGSRISLRNTSNIPEKKRKAVDRLWGLELPEQSQINYQKRGVDRLISILMNSSEQIEYLCLGPLTSLARATLKKPEICKQIKQLFIMGGAPHKDIDVSGFTGNGRIDLMATDLVYSQDLTITVLTQNVARNFPVDAFLIENLHCCRYHKVVDFIYHLIQHLLQHVKKQNLTNKLYMWDLVAAILFVYPHLIHIEPQTIRFVRNNKGEYTDILLGSEGHNIGVIVDINKNYDLIDILLTTFTKAG